MIRGKSWEQRWLYPASSEPPPILSSFEYLDQPATLPVYPQWRPPHYEQSVDEPITPPNVPFVESSWTMVFPAWSIANLNNPVELGPIDNPSTYYWDERKQIPEFPPWRPPDHPSYYWEGRKPELETRYVAVRRPWKPLPWLESYYQEDEVPFVSTYENLPRLPVWPKPWPRFPWKSMEEEPPEEGWDFIPPMLLLPPQKPYFMPDQQPPEYIPTTSPELCPPPCLRRPAPLCPPPTERPYASPGPP